MKIAHFDCFSGISGDMTLAALLDLGVPLEYLNAVLASLDIPGLALTVEEVRRKGFRAKKITVIHPRVHDHRHHEHKPDHEHKHHGDRGEKHEKKHGEKHRHLSDIRALIERAHANSGLTERTRSLALAIFTRIAEAEARVHGCDIERVHFHEVGAIDSIADIIGCAAGFDYLGIERFTSGPPATGTGTVTIAHGECPIPAPATALLLKDIPIHATAIPFELTTPTGAGILKTLVSGFGSFPPMRLDAIGCGAGGRDLEQQANILRILVGETAETTASSESGNGEKHGVWVLETNLDDMSGESVGYVVERLWKLAPRPLDVWTTPIQMKKNRPGVTLSVLCEADHREAVEHLLFMETTTLGIRRHPVARTVLERTTDTVRTAWGELRIKRAVLPDGSHRISPEYESARELAERSGIPLHVLYDSAGHDSILRSGKPEPS